MLSVPLSTEEEAVLKEIHTKTQELNSNNNTRTKGYLDFYRNFPEIHWAFLAHMVSRNGGWNMTDLKGELLMNLLSKQEKQAFFLFLERANWLIFQDAYPQLLVYEESLKRNKPFFHLFPSLKISTFMEVIWNDFWKTRNSEVLTVALIINEQNYLEMRVVQNPVYQNGVLNTLEFKLQELLSFNQLLFPYIENHTVNLSGQTLHQFASLSERIEFGKVLYSLLFQNHEFLKKAENWALEHPHTGSRKDYWPHLFHSVHEGLPGKYLFHLKNCKLRPGSSRIYSPTLENAWKNVNHQKAEEGDWYENWQIAEKLTMFSGSINREIKNEYCLTLERLELVAVAKKVVSFFD